ncbi:MAG: spore protease YyaC [Candidatus Cohnella colombiensis]|uniref:Spore protease YyaC n=1 Tax=Candidatus Cohnella colombiensis TaxID=3121368 RepID=A0AA95JBC5_9BACL|nr:MAG: spore protease YyaC [Cohnella sp.]
MTDKNSKIYYSAPDAPIRLVNQLAPFLSPITTDRRIVVVCIGTDRSTGDALGPLVGTFLRKFNSAAFEIYGTLDQPVHALNLDDTLEQIYEQYDNPYVIGIDACLGNSSSIGAIQVADGPIHPGAGVHKKLTPVGNIHISAVVNVGGMMEYLALQTTRLHLVVSMATLIARSLFVAIVISARGDAESASTAEQ